jgi:hypothetical protein
MLDTNALELRDTIVEDTDPLKLDLENSEFIQTINDSISQSITYYKNKRLPERQDKMLDYYLGAQLTLSGPNALTPTQPRYVENVIYEGIRRIKPIATSRLPDLTVKHGESPEIETLMTDLLNTDISKRKNRKVLGLAHVQEQIFLYSVIKARWNPEAGDDGDYEFGNVYPKNIVWDHRCKTSNADDMRFIAENTEMTVKEVLMMFPKAKEELLKKLGIDLNDQMEKKLASPITIWEVWFHWWKEKKDEVTGESKWEKVNAVVWKYQEVVLGKMKNPYFDYEGRVTLFTKEMKEKTTPTDEEMLKAYMGELQLLSQKTYHNYFKAPRKPYFFMVYESLGQDPIDATNRVEQVLLFQDHINDEGRQIIEMNERSAGKPIFNTEALDAKTIKNLDWKNTKQAIGVGGDDVNKAFAFAQMPAAPAQLYKSKEENRSIAFEMLGVNATTRGINEGKDTTLGQEQMYREQDFGFIDDLVEDTINDAAEWMAQWSMQFIKVFYTKDHYKEVVGKDGDSLFQAVNQDIVDDGMVVEVSASAVDKMMRKQLAMQNMKLGVSDSLSYFEDLGVPDPKERALRNFMEKNSPMMYYQTYLVKKIKPTDPNAPVDPNASVDPNAPIDPNQPPVVPTVPPVEPPITPQTTAPEVVPTQ